MKTKYNQIVDIDNIASHQSIENIQDIITMAQREQLTPVSEDQKKTLLLAIDIQNDFMEGIGSLGVPGSKGDVQHLTEWIYNNIDKLSQVICSLDSHSISQIFHADWWMDTNGHSPTPFTIITYQNVIDGKWSPRYGEINRSLEYLKNLEHLGKKQLCIWPYHCLMGTKGAKLESEFTKMLYFHAAARKSTPIFVSKGQNPYTEMYGIIRAEYDTKNEINQNILDAILEYDAIYIAGEASSHCVLESVIQIVEYFSDQKDITSKITVLEDCMSPIAGFEQSTIEQYEMLKSKYGIQVKKTTDTIL